MEIVNTPAQSPGCCFLCEQTNPVDHVDLFKHFDPGVVTRLSGRKYVCVDCIRDLAKLIGFSTPAEAEKMKEAVAAAEAAMKDAVARASALESLAAAVEAVVAAPKPKAKKAAAPKSEA